MHGSAAGDGDLCRPAGHRPVRLPRGRVRLVRDDSELGERCTEVRRAMDGVSSWTGDAADGARRTFTAHADRLYESSNAIFEAYKLFHEAGDRISAAKAKLMPGVPDVEYWGLTVAADGTITDDN